MQHEAYAGLDFNGNAKVRKCYVAAKASSWSPHFPDMLQFIKNLVNEGSALRVCGSFTCNFKDQRRE